MRNAERFLSQGKIRAAIGEYKKIVENDPRDFSTMNTLGDLYTKDNESGEAISCFQQVAEHYSKQGFAQKAIAVYNKISRLQPNSIEVSAKLAQLYQMKGSYAEARKHYVVLAEQYQQKGQKMEALEIWKQVAQLDPNNTEVYLKIADFCLQSDQTDEAVKAYTEAAGRFANLSQFELSLNSYVKALELSPQDLPALNGFVKTQVRLGNSDEAAKKLEAILEEQPYNREILYMLVDCYIDANNPAEAEKTVISLVEQEPANYPKFLDLIELYVKNDDLESAVRILSMSSEHLLVGGKSDEFFKWTSEILARNPEQLDALRLLVRYYGWQRDESELKNALERLAETAHQQQSIDDERYALAQLAMIVPHEINYTQRLHEIIAEYGGEMPEPLIENYGAKAAQTEYQPGEFEISSFDDFSSMQTAEPVAEAEFFEDYVAYESEAGLSEKDAFIYDENNVGQNGFSSATNEYDFAVENFEVDTAEVLVSDQQPAVAHVNGQNGSSLSTAAQLKLEQELEAIEFYINQGYVELADQALYTMEAEFGPRPEFELIRQRLNISEPAAAELEPAHSFSIVETTVVSQTPPEVVPEMVPEIVKEERVVHEPYDFLSDFRSDLGLEEPEAAEEGDYDTHYQTAIAYKEMGLMEEAIREFQDAVNLVRSDDGTRRFFHCCNLLGLCFMERGLPNLALLWYRRAMETPNLNEEEKQALLYETGNAYEMGGEKPKALEFFEQIYAVNVDYRDVSLRLENLRSESLVMR